LGAPQRTVKRPTPSRRSPVLSDELSRVHRNGRYDVITIYHLEVSRSERVIWLMEELALPYKLERFARDPSRQASAAYRAIHPLGRSPIIQDGDTVLIESGAILEYIIHRHGEGRLAVPVQSPDYARYLQWMHFAEGSAMFQFLLQMFLGGFVPGVDQSL